MFILFLYRSSSSSRFFRFRAILPIWVTLSWTDIFPKNCHFFCNFDSCFQPLFALVRLFQLFLQVNHMSRSFFFFFRLTWTFFCGCRISGRGEFSLLKKMKSCHKRIWIRQSSSSDSIRAVNWTLSSDTETNATTTWEQVQNLWRAQWKLVTTDVFYGCPPRYIRIRSIFLNQIIFVREGFKNPSHGINGCLEWFPSKSNIFFVDTHGIMASLCKSLILKRWKHLSKLFKCEPSIAISIELERKNYKFRAVVTT